MSVNHKPQDSAVSSAVVGKTSAFIPKGFAKLGKTAIALWLVASIPWAMIVGPAYIALFWAYIEALGGWPW